MSLLCSKGPKNMLISENLYKKLNRLSEYPALLISYMPLLSVVVLHDNCISYQNSLVKNDHQSLRLYILC